MTKPLPALGLVIGVIATYVGLTCAMYASVKLVMRVQTFRTDMGTMLPWLVVMVVIAAALGALMIVPSIGAGVTTGSGLLMTVVGLAMVLLPIRQAIDLSKLFNFPGTRYGGAYMLFDGGFILFGLPLLLIGIRRWALDAKLARVPGAPGLQDSSGYQSTFPQQTQQWGGYPGQQQAPGQESSPQSGEQSGQPPQYPGQQPPR